MRMMNHNIKRLIGLFVLSLLFLVCIPATATAAERTDSVLYMDDGSYFIVETVEYGMRASGTKTGKKSYTYYDSDNVSQWNATLTGKFTYTGSSATCTSSSVDVTIYDSSWVVAYKLAGKSGNKATASITMSDKLAGVTIISVPVSLSLSCDANGNLS